jgi:hypothetical protein
MLELCSRNSQMLELCSRNFQREKHNTFSTPMPSTPLFKSLRDKCSRCNMTKESFSIALGKKILSSLSDLDENWKIMNKN